MSRRSLRTVESSANGNSGHNRRPVSGQTACSRCRAAVHHFAVRTDSVVVEASSATSRSFKAPSKSASRSFHTDKVESKSKVFFEGMYCALRKSSRFVSSGKQCFNH